MKFIFLCLILAGLIISFQTDQFVVDEGASSIEICVESSGPSGNPEGMIRLEITTESVTASSKQLT